MVDLSSFRSRIAPRVLTALDYTIDLAVLDTCIDFCEKSLVVQAVLDPIVTVAGVAQYDLSTPVGTKVAKVMRAFQQTTELEPRTRDAVDTPFGWASSIAGSTDALAAPSGFFNDQPSTITLLPTPDKAYTLTVVAATKPARTATKVDDKLYEDWCDGIVDGALARLYAMPGQPFTNPNMQAVHMATYMQAVNRAMLLADRGRNRAESRIRPVWI